MEKLNIDTLQLFLYFVVPGFVGLKTYGLLVPSQKLKLSEAFAEAMSYSMINLGILWWPIRQLRLSATPDADPLVYYLGNLFAVLVAPAALAFAFHSFRLSHWARSRLLHPAASGWDFFFSQRRSCFNLFHLKNGKLLGGFYGSRSFASAHPEPPEVFVEEVWRVDEHGRFGERVSGTLGSLIRLADCDRLEFLEAREET